MTPLGGDEIKKRIKRSRKQEKNTAERYKGSRNAGSGAGWLRKNDVRTHEFLIENKFTDNKKQYAVKLKDMKEVRQQAILEDRIPVMQFEVGGSRFVVLYEDDFLEITND